MQAELVTACSLGGYAAYGATGIETMRDRWPIPLTVYADTSTDVPGAEVRLTTEIPGWPGLRAQLPAINPSAANPTNYIWNARKFAVKCAVWAHAAAQTRAQALVWLDADTVTVADLPPGLVSDLLGPADVAYLGRRAMHPETGCVVFRLPEALPVIHGCLSAYQTDTFRYWADGWTDCHALRWALQATGVPARDLTS